MCVRAGHVQFLVASRSPAPAAARPPAPSATASAAPLLLPPPPAPQARHARVDTEAALAALRSSGAADEEAEGRGLDPEDEEAVR